MKYRFLLLVSGLTALGMNVFAADEWVPIERVEASVNTSLILLSDIEKLRSVISLRAQLDPLFSQTVLSTKAEKASATELTEYLIDEKMIQQAFPAADADVEQEINSIQANNHIDRNALKTALKDQGFAFEDYFDIIRASISKRNLIDREIRTKVTITDDDVKNYYYNKVSKNSSIPVSYMIKVLQLSPKNYKSSAAMKDVAQRAVKSLKDGDSFDEVIKRYGDDSSSTGGEMGPLAENQLSPLFRESLKKMKIGETSPLLGNMTQGYFIIKLLDIKSSESSQLDKMKDEIRTQLFTSEYQHQIALWIERQKQKTFIHRTQNL